MTTPDPDPLAPGPSSPDDSPTSPLDLPPFTTAETPPAAPTSPAPPPAAPWPGSIPPAPLSDARPSAGMPPSSGAWGSSPLPSDATAPGSGTPAARRVPEPNSQPALVIGLILVIIGGVVLVTRVADLTIGSGSWPLWIVVPGVAMLIASFAVPPRGGLGLAVPGAIIATVGLVLWFQDTYDAYATWAYAWALVAPTAAGVGTMLYGLTRGDRELAGDGFRTTLVGLALFAGFALFFEGVLGLSGEPIANLDEVLPYGLIGLGILFVVLSFVGGGRRREQRAR